MFGRIVLMVECSWELHVPVTVLVPHPFKRGTPQSQSFFPSLPQHQLRWNSEAVGSVGFYSLSKQERRKNLPKGSIPKKRLHRTNMGTPLAIEVFQKKPNRFRSNRMPDAGCRKSGGNF